MHKKDKTPQRLFGFEEQSAPLAHPEVSFGHEDYTLVWQSLLAAVGETNYFSGKIHTVHEGFCSELTLSAIIYRNREHPERPICDIVPIWWEMTTFDSDGNELLNDFSLRELLKKEI